MDYDPVKDRIGRLIEGRRWLQPLFFRALHCLFLRAWYVRRELRRLGLRHGSRVLDAGMGFGQYAWHIVRRYKCVHVTGTDIKADYLARARAFFNSHGFSDRVEVTLDNITSPSVRGPFECILTVDVLEHIEDDDTVLRTCARLLGPGGHWIISTPSDKGGSGVTEPQDEGFIGEHVRDGYNREVLEARLRKQGLHIVRSLFSYGPWGSAAWRLLIKVPMQLLGRSWVFAPVVALYYLPILPIGLLLNWIDLTCGNRTGTGLILVARKPVG